MNKEQKRIIGIIVELVEDKNFPARRNITDYVELLLVTYGADRKEIEEYFKKEYAKYDSKLTTKPE